MTHFDNLNIEPFVKIDTWSFHVKNKTPKLSKFINYNVLLKIYIYPLDFIYICVCVCVCVCIKARLRLRLVECKIFFKCKIFLVENIFRKGKYFFSVWLHFENCIGKYFQVSGNILKNKNFLLVSHIFSTIFSAFKQIYNRKLQDVNFLKKQKSK